MAPTPYTLYYSAVSVASQMARYSLAIRGPSKDGTEISLQVKEVDIHFRLDQMSEDFLLNINPKGKVPVLTSPSLSKPMPDSKVITNYFAETYPQLKPAGYEARIDEVLEKIHAPLPYFILSFGENKAQPVVRNFVPTIQALLAKGNISEKYRKALEYKLSLHTGADLDVVLGPESITEAKKTMRNFLDFIDSNLPSSDGWLFGLPSPSAADGHVVPLLKRMHDVGRDELLPPKVKKYAERIWATPEFREAIDGYGVGMAQGAYDDREDRLAR